jgi:tryptophan synthase alpha chain
MSTLPEVFAHCRSQGRAALICYLPAGYPSQELATQAMAAAVEAGADIIEVGVPYSDPLMDGPVIQQAVQASLEAGCSLAEVLDTVRALQPVLAAQPRPVAVVLMSYWNPIEQYGLEALTTALAQAGGAGVITPDLIPDEAAAWISACDQQGLSHIFLVAPSSNSARLQLTVGACTGFVYAASTMGVTGTRTQVGQAAQGLVLRTRAYSDPVELPVCVGLGVSTPQQAAQVAGFADGVIVGSALVKLLVEHDHAGSADKGPEAVGNLAGELAQAVQRR